MDRIYLIKNPNVWMLDELIVFSRHVRFKILFLRKPNDSYRDKLAQLESNGVEIAGYPFNRSISVKKMLFCLRFVIKNLPSFLSRYSFVVGVKSIWWFLWIEDSYFRQPASIHAQFATQPALISLLLSKYHSQNKVEYYFTFHAYDIFFRNRWFTKLVNNSKKSFSISQYNLEYVMEKYEGLNPSKLELSRLGAFSNDFDNASKLKSDTLRIGFISWFVEKKGIKYLLEAMKQIATDNKNIKLILAGDGPLRNEIEEYIQKNGLSDSISYIGKLNSEEKDRFFSNIDALILPAITLPNDKDGIPVVLMEAISYGLPLISTNISGIPEICIDNYNGLLVPEKDVGALVKAINTLYGNEEVINRFSRNSLEIFDKYKIENNSYSKLRKLEWIS